MSLSMPLNLTRPAQKMDDTFAASALSPMLDCPKNQLNSRGVGDSVLPRPRLPVDPMTPKLSIPQHSLRPEKDKIRTDVGTSKFADEVTNPGRETGPRLAGGKLTGQGQAACP